ncbi:hypothetical protein V8D89_005469 [Ganoderma adspersum]
MSNASTSPHASNSFSGANVGTVNNTAVSCETDYTVYYKVALIFLFVIASVLISGFAALAGAVRFHAQAVRDLQRHIYYPQAQDVEAHPSTSPLDGHEADDKAPEAGPSGKAPAADLLDEALEKDSLHPPDPQHPPPPTREKRGRRLLKKLQKAVSNGGWSTHVLNAAEVAVACVLSGPPSLQYNLPIPVTDPRRSE